MRVPFFDALFTHIIGVNDPHPTTRDTYFNDGDVEVYEDYFVNIAEILHT